MSRSERQPEARPGDDVPSVFDRSTEESWWRSPAFYLFGLPFLVILTVWAAVNLWSARERQRVWDTASAMTVIDLALAQFQRDNGIYPEAKDGAALVALLRQGGYLGPCQGRSKELCDGTDAWGVTLRYSTNDARDDSTLASCGSDGACTGELFNDPRSDLILVDGVWKSFPFVRGKS